MKTIQQQREALEGEKRSVETWGEKACEEVNRARKRLREIDEALRRLAFTELVNVPNAVVIDTRYPAGDPLEKLNDRTGTILCVRRKFATVDFGDGAGRWNWPLHSLLPAEQKEKQRRRLWSFGEG